MQITLTEIPVMYINLDSATHKRYPLEATLTRSGFTDVRRIPAVKDLNGYVGLCKSQIKALKSMSVPFLLLEDDAVISEAELCFRIPESADALYLGTSNWALQGNKTTHFLRYNRTGIQGVLRIRNMLSAHAILFLTEDFKTACIESLEKNLEQDFEISDRLFARLQKTYMVYCIDQPVFIQGNYDDSISDASSWTHLSLTSYPRSFQVGPIGLPLNKPAISRLIEKIVRPSNKNP